MHTGKAAAHLAPSSLVMMHRRDDKLIYLAKENAPLAQIMQSFQKACCKLVAK